MNKETQNIFQRLFDFSAVAVFAINPEHEVIYWNRSCEILTGISAEAMDGTTNQWQPFYDRQRPCLSDIVISGEYERLPQLYKKFGRSVLVPNGLHAEGWYEHLGGKRRYIIFDAAPIYNQDGELIAATETLQDITEDKLAEEKKEQLLVALQEEMSSVRSITGYIPICASCKNIRLGNNTWITVEQYVSDRTGAKFSHGICPRCAEKLYPEYFRNQAK